jgi:hypothetical protein
MFHHVFRAPVCLALAALTVSCVNPGRDSDPVAQASEPENPSVEALGSLEKVYVPLQAESMLSLDDALAEKGYGNVTSSDFKPRFELFETEFGPAVVAYSSSDWVEPESLFAPMSVTQWLDAALADPEAQGVVINPRHPGQTLALTRAELTQALAWLPKQEPLPMEIYVTQ